MHTADQITAVEDGLQAFTTGGRGRDGCWSFTRDNHGDHNGFLDCNRFTGWRRRSASACDQHKTCDRNQTEN